jgi:hypothetical protein
MAGDITVPNEAKFEVKEAETDRQRLRTDPVQAVEPVRGIIAEGVELAFRIVPPAAILDHERISALRVELPGIASVAAIRHALEHDRVPSLHIGKENVRRQVDAVTHRDLHIAEDPEAVDRL